MSSFEVRGQWTSLSSAPLPWSSLPDAEVPLVSCLLGCPGLSSAHGYPAKQIPVPISHETTKVGFNISHGTGGSISALRQENAWKVWGEPGVSPEGNRRTGSRQTQEKYPVHESCLHSKAPHLPLFCQGTLPSLHITRHRYLIWRFEVWLLLAWLCDQLTDIGWASVMWWSPGCWTRVINDSDKAALLMEFALQWETIKKRNAIPTR